MLQAPVFWSSLNFADIIHILPSKATVRYNNPLNVPYIVAYGASLLYRDVNFTASLHYKKSRPLIENLLYSEKP